MKPAQHTIIFIILQLLMLLTNGLKYQFHCQRIAWFMAFAWDRDNFHRLNEIKFAILSAKQHSPMLQPILIYQKAVGGETEIEQKWMEWFNSNGVIICNANLEFLMMKEMQKHEQELVQMAKSKNTLKKYPIYYRLDIDDYMKTCVVDQEDMDTRFALYTDSDVAIISEINSCTIPKPSVIAMGAEHIPNKYWNGGVLVFNVKNYAKQKKNFAKYFEESWQGWNDQKMLNHYFNKVRNDMILLPNAFNYKYYWESLEMDEKPVIVHFHGYKLGHQCGICLSETSSKQEATEKCPRCSSTLWFYFGSTGGMYKAFFEYYKELVYKQPPYLNLTNNQMHTQE